MTLTYFSLSYLRFLLPDTSLFAMLPAAVGCLLLPTCRNRSLHFRLGVLLFAAYLGAMAVVTGVSSLLCGLSFSPTINLIPFHDFYIDLPQYALNVLLFLPLGVLLPLLWADYADRWRVIRFGFCLSLLIECCQMFCLRMTDLNDLMTNTLGAALGWMLWQRVLRGRSFGAGSPAPRAVLAFVWVVLMVVQGIFTGFVWNVA